jgi:asparagine synthase (glutamine-hydrolysing)
MFRFIGVIWNPSDPVQSEASNTLTLRLDEFVAGYRPVFSTEGFRVLCAEIGTPGFGVHTLENNSGVLLGSVFRRNSDLTDSSPNSAATFESRDTDRIISSQGRLLISDYWGDYVAFLTDRASGTRWVIKDPTGKLPCFTTSWRQVTVVFSCIEDCVSLKCLPFTVNWTYLASKIGSGGYDSSVSPLNEVAQVHRGQCLEIVASQSRRQSMSLYWNPTTFSEQGDVIEDTAFASRALRATVCSATHTLAASHEDVLMRLSGGLDSSIVSGMLKGAHPRLRVTSCTYFVANGKSDERRWARMAAEYAASAHHEIAMNPSSTGLETLTRIGPSVAPIFAYTYLAHDSMVRQLRHPSPYTAIFDGEGGDSGFGGECISFAVDDFLRLRGFSYHAIKLASQVALTTNTLIWGVLRAAIRRRYFGSFMKDYRSKLLVGAALANEKVLGAPLNTARYPHPWFADCDGVPWHVINRLGNLLSTPELYNPFLAPGAFSPYVASPLYSQPVIELCLRIPVYSHFHNGYERGLARRAFRDDVPEPILRRQWKDRAPGAFEELVRRNRVFIRETILGGILCGEGLLDRDVMHNALSGEISTQRFFVGEIMNYLHLEIWLRHFAGRSTQQLAA